MIGIMTHTNNTLIYPYIVASGKLLDAICEAKIAIQNAQHL